MAVTLSGAADIVTVADHPGEAELEALATGNAPTDEDTGMAGKQKNMF